jgi:hypothetical protein
MISKVSCCFLSRAAKNNSIYAGYFYWLPLLNEFRTADWKSIKQELELSGIMTLLSQRGFISV